MARKGTGESECVGEHSEHPLREMFAMFARTPRTSANNVRLVRYVRTILVPTFMGRVLCSGRGRMCSVPVKEAPPKPENISGYRVVRDVRPGDWLTY
jgi:hypothetical protein